MRAAAAIGGSHVRVDSVAKVTGRTRYVEDLPVPGLLHAFVLRSPHPHARLLRLDPSAAARLPGVIRILTALDIPGLNGLDGYSRDEPVLAAVGDTLRQKGAPIALVVADSRRQAQAAAGAILVDLEVLAHTFDAEEALAQEAAPIYPGGNVLGRHSVRHGDLEAAFAGSDLVLEAAYRTSFQEHATLERNSQLGYLDEQGRVTVLGGTHEPHWQQGYIAQTLGLDPEQVRVIMPPTGGSFGDRQDPWPLVAVGLMVHLVRRPVRLVYSRREVFDATPKRHPYEVRMRIGATAEGRLTGIRVRITANTGGYDSAGFWIPNYALTAVGGPYRWRAMDAYAQSVYTNAAKCGQFRGFGSPQAAFASECALDELCQRLDLDPIAFRLDNRLHQDSISFLGYPVAETLGYLEVLEALRPRHRELLREAEAFNAREPANRRMGVGLAGMWYRFGKSGSLRVEAHAELALDGHVVVYCSAPDYGQGIGTVMLQLAAEALGVPRERVELVNADTATTPDSGIQGASRATYFIGSAVALAAGNLKREILAVAAGLLGIPAEALVLDRDRVVGREAPDRAVTLAAVAGRFEAEGRSRRVQGVFDLSPQFPDGARPEYIPCFVTGAQLAQVIVDLETGQVRVLRIVAAHDVGRAINPPNAIGQIQGAIVMGAGAALCEEYLPGRSTSLADYILPMVGEVPAIEVQLIEVPSRYGPFGAKGLGEAAILPTAPAILNALSRAIGVRVRAIPATPPRVLRAIQGRAGAD
jgi:CO/xanthine dehydrogenase Mo-binding subunit